MSLNKILYPLLSTGLYNPRKCLEMTEKLLTWKESINSDKQLHIMALKPVTFK